ncbi:MAG TPA: response regulator [Candidatus Methylacidiphilales bacterium]|nr:response regulator [Candidatus Methylacidiphilales bacterium]
MPPSPIQVYVVDDEPSVCIAYARLLRSAKMQPRTFSSVEELLQADISRHNACVISDVRMPGASGFTLPALLAQAGYRLPVILVTAFDTPSMRDLAQQAGAAAYFRKPVDDQALLDAIVWALGQHENNRSEN